MPTPSSTILRRLEKAARAAAQQAYAPYSKFPVGAAVLAESGRIYAGCNVENAAYPLCNCAERTALYTGIAAGERRFQAVVVYTPTSNATLPCGACRQVINEFAPEAFIVGVCDSEERVTTTLPELLPRAFGPATLAAAARPAARHQRDA